MKELRTRVDCLTNEKSIPTYHFGILHNRCVLEVAGGFIILYFSHTHICGLVEHTDSRPYN